jgi:hypothetical protein
MDLLIEAKIGNHIERKIIRVNDKLIPRKKRIVYQPLNARKYVRY